MTPIVIETDLTRSDWVDLCAYFAQRHRDAQSARTQILWIAVVAAVVVLALELLRRAGARPDIASLLVGVCIPIIVLVVARRFFRARGPVPGNAFLGAHRYELDENGVRTIRAGTTGVTDWSRIEQIDETPTAIYLALDRLAAYVIPKRSVDASILPTLVQQLRQWHQQRMQTPQLAHEMAAGASNVSGALATVPGMQRTEVGFFRALLGNLRAGLRLLLWRRVEPTDFTVSFDQLVALLAIVLLLIGGVDWLLCDPEAEFDAYGLSAWAYYVLGGLWIAALIARLQSAQTLTRNLLVAWLATVPGIIVLLGLLLLLPFTPTHLALVLGAAALVLMIVSDRVVRRVFGFTKLGTSVLIVAAIAGLPWFFQTQLLLEPQLWVLPSEQDTSADDTVDAESVLFDQPDRIADAVDSTAPERPGITDTYFVGFAGFGEQRVFRSEALFSQQVFAKRFGTGRRSVELINDRHDRDTYPLATVSSLRYALELLGERMDKDDDILLLFLTSHASREDGFAIRNGALPLDDLQPEDLRGALDDSGIKWRVIIVSACYSGIFLEPLESDSTLVITAADADHTSFGCADDRDLTYFGEAFLRDALPGAPSIEAAFAKARALIAARERAEKLTPSNPQMFVGPEIRRKLAAPPAPIERSPEEAPSGSTVTASAILPRGLAE